MISFLVSYSPKYVKINTVLNQSIGGFMSDSEIDINPEEPSGDYNDQLADKITKLAERCQLVMHVHSCSNSGDGSQTNLKANLDANLDGRWLMPDAARRLACDAGLL